jgi:hypothetical protein
VREGIGTVCSRIYADMRLLLPFLLALIAGSAQAQAPSCDKPYHLGHFVQLGNEDLRLDRTRPITKKELQEWNKKQEQAQAVCNEFVSEHPNLSVSREFSYTVKGFATVREPCESSCGTEEELDQLYGRENR